MSEFRLTSLIDVSISTKMSFCVSAVQHKGYKPCTVHTLSISAHTPFVLTSTDVECEEQ